MSGFETYQDDKKEWWWKYTASNGEIVGSSDEGFTTENGAIKNSERLSAALQKSVSSDECLRYAMVGVSCTMINTHRSEYNRIADECIKYMLKSKKKVNITNGIEILRERIKAFVNNERENIFDEEEWKTIDENVKRRNDEQK